MEVSHYELPKRSERQKNKKQKEPPEGLFFWGLLWSVGYSIPSQWLSIWSSITVAGCLFYISKKFEKMKLPSQVKWSISCSIFFIGLVVLYLHIFNQDF
nr:hypothetical protein [Ectobacillus panaciterrae]